MLDSNNFTPLFFVVISSYQCKVYFVVIQFLNLISPSSFIKYITKGLHCNIFKEPNPDRHAAGLGCNKSAGRHVPTGRRHPVLADRPASVGAEAQHWEEAHKECLAMSILGRKTFQSWRIGGRIEQGKHGPNGEDRAQERQGQQQRLPLNLMPFLALWSLS